MAKKKKTDGYQTFYKNLSSGSEGKLILIHGKEQYLADWAVKETKKKYIPENTEIFNFSVIEGYQCDAGEIIATCEALPVMAEKRLIWIKDCRALESGKTTFMSKKDREKLASYFTNVPNTTILILSNSNIDGKLELVKSLKKNGCVYEFDALSKKDFGGFAVKRLRERGVSISEENLQYLIDCTGYFNKENDYCLDRFYSDLVKLSLHCDDGIVTATDIENTVCTAEDLFIFNLLDNIMSNKRDRALVMLRSMLDKNRKKDEEAFRIIYRLADQYEILLAIKEEELRGNTFYSDVGKKIGVNEYRVKFMIPHARKKSVEDIKKNLAKIYEIPRSVKTGLMPVDLALELFIAGA